MDTPTGYPPPTLIRKRSGIARLRYVLALLIIAVVLGTCTFTRMIDRAAPPPARPKPVPAAPAVAEAAPAPQVAIDDLRAPAAPLPPSTDGREANRWYYVARLGDGPGAIYSRDGGKWSFALACTPRTQMIEFIAVGMGSPGDFEGQAISAGTLWQKMDATYSSGGGGTISARLPARGPLFDAVLSAQEIEVRLLATRRTILPVGPDVVRLIEACRDRA